MPQQNWWKTNDLCSFFLFCYSYHHHWQSQYKMLKQFHALLCCVHFVWGLQRLEKTRGFSPFTLAGKYLPLASLKTFVLKDWLHCVIACQQQEGCLSYNYNFVKKNCELLNEGIVRQDGCFEQLLESRETIYHQMKVSSLFIFKLEVI